MTLPDALDLLRLRDDELAQVVRSLDHQPHLVELDLGPRVAVLELVVALAAWRSQPIAVRVQAIKDAAALCLARPPLQPRREPARPDVPELRPRPRHVEAHHRPRGPLGPL